MTEKAARINITIPPDVLAEFKNMENAKEY
jgi:hypothetical protein